jgi:hypothetical protein
VEAAVGFSCGGRRGGGVAWENVDFLHK